jgi:hypothetical protein
MPGQAQWPRDDRVLAVRVDQHRGVEPLAILKLPPEGIMRRSQPRRHTVGSARAPWPAAGDGHVSLNWLTFCAARQLTVPATWVEQAALSAASPGPAAEPALAHLAPATPSQTPEEDHEKLHA